MKLVVADKREGQIKDELCGAYGIGGWQSGRYLHLARDRLAEEHGLGPDFDMDALRARHYAHAMSIFKESKDDKARVQALRHAGSIYGVGTPNRVAPNTPEVAKPNELKVAAEEAVRDLSTEELRILKKVGQRMTAIVHEGKPGSN